MKNTHKGIKLLEDTFSYMELYNKKKYHKICLNYKKLIFKEFYIWVDFLYEMESDDIANELLLITYETFTKMTHLNNFGSAFEELSRFRKIDKIKYFMAKKRKQKYGKQNINKSYYLMSNIEDKIDIIQVMEKILTREEQNLLLASCVLEIPNTEIAKKLGVHRKTVANRLKKIKDKVKGEMTNGEFN